MFLRQSTASQVVELGPFLDDTDFKTAETGLTIANTDIKLRKGGGTSHVSKNSGGSTHIANGYYHLTLDATDTDTVGILDVHVNVSGALPVFDRLTVLPAHVHDLWMTDGTGVALALKSLSIINSSGTALYCESSGGNGIGIYAKGNGSGDGMRCESTGEGNGLAGIGGGVGNGLHLVAGATGVKLSSADYTGAVVADGSNTATTFKTDLTQTEVDHWKNAFLKFTSGTLKGQVQRVSAFNPTTDFITMETAFTTAPTVTDTFELVNE